MDYIVLVPHDAEAVIRIERYTFHLATISLLSSFCASFLPFLPRRL